MELAFGRRPPDLLDIETLDPAQTSTEPLPEDKDVETLRKIAMKSHIEARQHEDLLRDLSIRLRPSDGIFRPGDRVFVWSKE